MFQIALFLILGLSIMLGSHYFLYFSFVRVFAIENPNHKIMLLACLMFLAISFILASILAHYRDDAIARGLYFLSGFWLGLATNLFLSACLLWLLIGIKNIFNFDLPIALLGVIFLVIAFFVSIFGVWNALNPKIKNITVTIPNLPENWKGEKVIQLSDVHLGHLYRKDFLAGIVSQVNAQNPKLVVITGDLFDGMDGNLENLIGPLDDIKSKDGTYFITGNHETYLGVDKTIGLLKKTPVHILDNQVAEIEGLRLIGLSYAERGDNSDPIAKLESLKPEYLDKPNILLYHSPTNIEEFSQNGINLQLSGHTHLGQMIPFNLITKLIYHGYDYGLHRIGNYTLYTTNGIGTWGPLMRIGNTPEIVVITLN